MHELGITQSVVDAVREHTAGAKVASVQLQVGRLSGIMPDAMRFCFDLVTDGTPLQGARLDIEEPDGQGHCKTCDADIVLPDLILLCPCGSADVTVTAGRELRVTSVDVAPSHDVRPETERHGTDPPRNDHLEVG